MKLYLFIYLHQRMMSNELQSKFSMVGFKEKLKFENTLLYKAINSNFIYSILFVVLKMFCFYSFHLL